MNYLRYEVGEKVIIHSKSTGRDLHKAMKDVRHRIKRNNKMLPIGWITEIRNAYPAYFVISYIKGWSGTDYYFPEDLRKIDMEFVLEDDLFEI